MCEKSKISSLKILSVGNSFSADTMEYVAEIALALGIQNITLGNLYKGGCSIRCHWDNAQKDTPAYRYYRNNGEGWSETSDFTMARAIADTAWDWISIQHGTHDGSRYTLPASYESLPSLIAYIKAKAAPHTKIAFNMAWAMESYSTHPEIRAYEGNTVLMYEKLAKLTQALVLPMVDRVSPAGTAIQNARNTILREKLSRDGFHLSYDIGRYIAGLTFFKALTGADINKLTRMPDGVSDAEREIAICAANQAVACPFQTFVTSQ